MIWYVVDLKSNETALYLKIVSVLLEAVAFMSVLYQRRIVFKLGFVLSEAAPRCLVI